MVGRLVAAVALFAAGCHVITRDQVTRPIRTERVRHSEAIARPPTLVLTEAGRFRFVEPLECATEDVVTTETATEIQTRPNLATFVVGVIAAGAGIAMGVNGIAGDDPASSPLTYAGLGGLAVGLPFAIGPWIGTRIELEPGPATLPTRRPGPNEPCGERAVVASAGTLTTRGIEVRGRVDGDGVFSVSPYQLVDAFETTAVPTLDVHAVLDGAPGITLDAVIDGGTLARGAPAFLASAGFDARVEPMRLVPGIQPGVLRVSLTATADGPAIRIVLPVHNDGPGPTWGLRAHVVAPGTPALDGRVLYAGHVAKNGSGEIAGIVPVAAAAAEALRNTTIELSLELRDAHGTAPTTPIRYRGVILVDAPR